MLMGKYNTVN